MTFDPALELYSEKSTGNMLAGALKIYKSDREVQNMLHSDSPEITYTK